MTIKGAKNDNYLSQTTTMFELFRRKFPRCLMKMSLSYQYLDANLDILDGLGFPKARALNVLNMSVSDLAVSHERLGIDAFQACLTAAAEFTSDENIGLRLGHKFRVGAFGSTGSLYSYCENLEQVIAMNNLYQKIAIDLGQVEYFLKSDGSHHLCLRPYYSDVAAYRLLTDMILAANITAYRWLSWGSGEDIICARLPYIRDDQIQTYADILQTPVKRDAPEICVEFSDAAMSQNITTHNPERLARTRIRLDKLLGEQTDKLTFEAAIEAAIRGAIDAGTVSFHVVAKRMGMSESVLRAQLAVTGKGFRPRLNRVRKSLFVEKYEAGHNFSQIALDLAYNDQAAMNRAFRRWFGMTPSQWRKKH